MGELLEKRRVETDKRIGVLRSELGTSAKLCGRKACVYATGSFGRREASAYSDLDLFIVGKGSPRRPSIRGLDEILIKANLIVATRNLKIKDFSGEGAYLKHYTVRELVDGLGTPEDDAENTFTARLLLLLESFPLVGATAYHQITDKVIQAYWRDYEHNQDEFVPAFLANDILRMWRTFCVNYEAGTRSEPEREMAKRRLKNYKLKHSRLLTCYSALVYLLAVYTKNKTVSPADAKNMISLTPTARLEWILLQPHCKKAHSAINSLIGSYESFLSKTDASEDDLVNLFMDKAERQVRFGSSYEFGTSVFKVFEIIGSGSLFYRLLVV
jgi:hypothetical protein